MTTTMTAVVSPWTGETVAVVPDADHAIAMGHPLTEAHRGRHPAGSVLTLQTARRLVLVTLWEHGPFTDKSGRATGKLYAAMRKRGYKSRPTALIGVLADMGAAVDRTINGKRTTRIALGLVPERWARMLAELPGPPVTIYEPSPAVTPAQADRAEAFAAEERAGVLAVEPLDATEAPDSTDEAPEPSRSDLEPSPASVDGIAPSVEVAGIVAMELLTRVVEIISTGTPPDRTSTSLRAERDEARRRLSESLDYTETLRRNIRKMEHARDVQASELAALRSERDGLRMRLRDTESNLAAALRGDAAAYVNGEVARAIDRVMRVSEPANGAA